MAKTILVVDDEPLVLKLVCTVLKLKSYVVLKAADGQEALQWLEDGHLPDLLLTDVRMPRLDGLDLAQQVRERIPGIKVVYMTGHPGELERFHADLAQGTFAHTLAKPFRPAALCALVESLTMGAPA